MAERPVQVPREGERTRCPRCCWPFPAIALLQNSERRYDEALHHKIDAVAAGLADLMEHEAEPNREVLERHIEDLRASVGLEREL
jgi:hypothetical protein